MQSSDPVHAKMLFVWIAMTVSPTSSRCLANVGCAVLDYHSDGNILGK